MERTRPISSAMPNSTGVGYAEMTISLLIQRIEKMENALSNAVSQQAHLELMTKVEQIGKEYEKQKAMNMDDTCTYLGISKSALYKLTSAKEIPHYKPMGKCIYFDRSEIDEWLRQNPIRTNAAVQSDVNTYMVRHPYKSVCARMNK